MRARQRDWREPHHDSGSPRILMCFFSPLQPRTNRSFSLHFKEQINLRLKESKAKSWGGGVMWELSAAKAYRLLFSQGKFLWCSSLFTEATGIVTLNHSAAHKRKRGPSILMLATRTLILHRPPPQPNSHTLCLDHSSLNRLHMEGSSFIHW